MRYDLQQPERGIDGVVISEISIGKEEVAAHFTGEGGFFFLHFALDQGVTGLPHYRSAAMLFNVVIKFLRALNLAYDGCAG